MNEKYKKRMPKFLPVGIAMGVLFSASPLAGPLTENKVKADVDTFGTIVTTFGEIYDAFLAEPFGKWLEEIDVKTTYKAFNENIAYKAPTFQKGEFGISAFDYYKNKDFSKKVKIAYANGKVEYKTIKHGEQIRIKDAGTIVDLTPDEPELSKHDILYITQKQLDEGNTGVSLTNFKTYYLKSDNSGGRNELGYKFLQKTFPNAYHNGIRDWGVNEDELFKKLPEEKRILGTITSEPVSKEKIFSLTESDINNMNYRMDDILTQHKEGEYSSLSVKIKTGDSFLRSWEDGRLSKAVGEIPLGRDHFKIIPIKKGSNKVILRENLQYIPSVLGSKGGSYNTIGPDKVWTLHDTGEKGLFVLQNDKGQYLSVDDSSAKFTDQYNEASLFNADLKSEKWNNWLIKWYPGKENEKTSYYGIQIVTDEKDATKQFAKDSSGDAIENSWITYGGFKYYTGSDGVLLKGWHDIEGKTYYFGSNGAFQKGVINPDIDGKQYHFDYEGALQRSVWENQKYSDHTGAFVKEGLREIDGKMYYFQNYNATKGEIRLENQNIILHFSDKGVLEKASMLNGEAISGVGTNFTLDGKKYYVNQNGEVLPTGWRDDGGTYGKYYLNDKSERVGGLQEIDGTLYYFADKGERFSYGTLWPDRHDKYYTDNNGATKRNFKGKTGNKSYTNGKLDGEEYIETDDSGRITVHSW
ncbi:cell wall-binding protein [Bacillus wiedmannii]|uniref:N-acetylmuramoyl-L-alanine amidase family protein n=1 Tax=Bacillus wiedmannii TaxID=1890302 RepID=UPI000BF127E8|nr:cell wall-binding protein [Bacillus wiedmannii]PEL75917.1 cell wall-binding protein [Bacillus wiedmannii]PHB05547.1 cell wall-binding protein [Bacillus wiedmannii]